MNKDNHDSIFQKNIQRGIDKGIIKIESDGIIKLYNAMEVYYIILRDQNEKKPRLA